jgi:hypothetical protein
LRVGHLGIKNGKKVLPCSHFASGVKGREAKGDGLWAFLQFDW